MKSLATAVLTNVCWCQERNYTFIDTKNKVYDKSHASEVIEEGRSMERGTISNLSSLRRCVLPVASSLQTHKQIPLPSPMQVPMGMQNQTWKTETLSCLHPWCCARALWEDCCVNTPRFIKSFCITQKKEPSVLCSYNEPLCVSKRNSKTAIYPSSKFAVRNVYVLTLGKIQGKSLMPCEGEALAYNVHWRFSAGWYVEP